MKWNKKNIDKLEALVADKKTARQIGDVLNTSKNSIIGKCRRMGFKLNSLVSRGPKRKRPVYKSDRMVLSSIKKHTDSQGWGLEFDEIVEYTGRGPNSFDITWRSNTSGAVSQDQLYFGGRAARVGFDPASKLNVDTDHAAGETVEHYGYSAILQSNIGAGGGSQETFLDSLKGLRRFFLRAMSKSHGTCWVVTARDFNRNSHPVQNAII